MEVVYTQKPGKAFLYGWLWGAIFMGTVTYWLIVLPGGFMGWSLYCIFYSIYPAFLCCILSFIKEYTGRKEIVPFLTPFIWVSMEYIRATGFMAFTWIELGHSQYNFLPLVQISSITGVRGISFLIISVNEFIREIISYKFPERFKSGNLGKKGLAVYGLSVILLSSLYGIYGFYRLKTIKIEEPSVKIAIIQPNIRQSMKWDPRQFSNIINKYFTMTKEAAKKNPDIIIWPETAVSAHLMKYNYLIDSINTLSKETKSSILLGTIDVEEHDNNKKIYNTAILFSPEGIYAEKYYKQHLVPFGEYLPGRKFIEAILGGAKGALANISRFSQGEKAVLFKTPKINFSVAICFESIFSEISREGMNKGAECIVIITNDAWFEQTAAPYQHNIISVFRAVENSTFILRCANTGVSCIIDPMGIIHEQTPIYEDKIIYGSISPRKSSTFYTLHGDVFSIFCLIIFLYVLIYCIYRKSIISLRFPWEMEIK